MSFPLARGLVYLLFVYLLDRPDLCIFIASIIRLAIFDFRFVELSTVIS